MAAERARTWYSSFDTVGEVEGAREKLWVIEARDIARGFCGALFLALPLLYTLEMWERARVIPSWDMALIVVLAYFGNVGFAMFDGFKPDKARQVAWFDALTAMGIGLAASAITLLLIGRYTFDTPSEILVKMLLLETVPASFGASLAINQLGTRSASGKKTRLHPDVRKILGTLLGATMFAFNVAPTIEPQVITFTLTWWHTLAVIAFSLVVSFIMVFFACFCVPDEDEKGVLGSRWTETLVSYLVSLTISAGLLWMFGYIDTNTPLTVVVPWVATLGYATTLGGSAGRLVL